MVCMNASESNGVESEGVGKENDEVTTMSLALEGEGWDKRVDFLERSLRAF